MRRIELWAFKASFSVLMSKIHQNLSRRLCDGEEMRIELADDADGRSSAPARAVGLRCSAVEGAWQPDKGADAPA